MSLLLKKLSIASRYFSACQFSQVTKVLALRLENILPDIIDKDRVGSNHGCSILYGNTAVAAFSLDAEKPSDVRGKFTQDKIIYTPVGLIQNNLCWKCNVEAGIFLHSLWDSSLVFPFWKEVIAKLGEWLEKTLTRISPTSFLVEDIWNTVLSIK